MFACWLKSVGVEFSSGEADDGSQLLHHSYSTNGVRPSGASRHCYHHISVAHIEAGLRAENMNSPWSEGSNRVLTTCLVRGHFCSTERESNRENLLKEGVPGADVYVTGITVIDALLSSRET